MKKATKIGVIIGIIMLGMLYIMENKLNVPILLLMNVFISLFVILGVGLMWFIQKEPASDIYFEYVEAYGPSYKLPKRGTSGSAGYDFFAPFDITLNPNESIVITTGVRAVMENPRNVLMLFPRSGLGFKYQCHLANTVGIIDSDYYSSESDGCIGIKLVNDGDKTFTIKQGDGYAQGVFLEYKTTKDDNVRKIRAGGFGSTTK